MAGTYEGREAIFRFLGRLPKETDGTYGSELIDVLASDDRAAALYRARGDAATATGSISTSCCSSASRAASSGEVLALPSDPAPSRRFWA